MIEIQTMLAVINIILWATQSGIPVSESLILSELKRTGISRNWENHMRQTKGHIGDFETTALFVIAKLRKKKHIKWTAKKNEGAIDNHYTPDIVSLLNCYCELITKLFMAVSPCDDNSGDYVYSCEADDGTILSKNFKPILTGEHMQTIKKIADRYGIDYAFTH